MDPSDCELLMEAAHAEWQRLRNEYIGLSNRMRAGMPVDSREEPALRENLDRAYRDFLSMAQQLHTQVLLLGKSGCETP